MKKVLKVVFIFIIFMIPSIVLGKTIHIDTNRDSCYSEEVFFDRGDEVIFDVPDQCNSFYYSIYFNDNNLFPDLKFGAYPDACNTDFSNSFIVPEDMRLVGGSADYSSSILIGSTWYYEFSLLFSSYDKNARIRYISDLNENDVIKSKDILVLEDTNESQSLRLYDVNGEQIAYHSLRGNLRTFVVPGENDYWQLHFINNGVYGSANPVLQKINYTEPQFSLRCDDKVINYGKKTKCHLYVNTYYEMSRVGFDMELPNFKVSNVVPSKGVSVANGSNKYNFNINEGYAKDGKEVEIMTFDLEGTRNENYTDDIKLTNIKYKDSILEGNYQELKSDLEIIPYKITNPKTLANLLYILLPILVLCFALAMNKLSEKNKKKI